MPERILHLCTELSVGGAENHLLTLLRGLKAQGHFDPHIAAFRDASGTMRSLRPDFEAAGIPVHILGQDRAFDVRGLLRLGRLLHKLAPTVLHTHLFRGDIFGPPIGALTGVPVRLSTVHNIEARFSHAAFSPLFRSSYFFDCSIVAISDAVARALKTSVRAPASKIKRIYYGFDPHDRWRDDATGSLRGELGFGSEDFVVGHIGRLCEQKGQRFLIEAIARVRRDQPRVKLLIVGAPEPDGTKELLEALTSQYGLEGTVVFAGYRDDVRRVLNTIDVFALPSLWEGFGLVLLEAMSMQIPIIASAVDSIPEIIEDGVEGILVPPADTTRLAEAILRLVRAPDECRQMAAAGPAKVARFSVERMVADTSDLYRTLLARHAHHRSLAPTT